jgi:hypothetical protein
MKLFFASMLMLTSSLSFAQNSMMQDVLKEQSKTMVQDLLSKVAAKDKQALKWLGSLSKEWKVLQELEQEHTDLLTLLNWSKELNVNLSELLIDIEVYENMGLKDAKMITLQSMQSLNKPAVLTLASSNKDRYLSLRNQLRGQASSSLDLLDIHLITMMEIAKLEKKNQGQYVDITYGKELGKSLSALMSKVNNYQKVRAKISMSHINEQVYAAGKATFSDQQLFQELLVDSFGNIPNLASIKANDPLGAVLLLLALDVQFPSDKKAVEAAIKSVYANPKTSGALLDKKEKSLGALQKSYAQMQPK